METYNKETIKSLLKDFYNLRKIKICIHDAFGNEVAFYPSKYLPFCKTLREDGNYNRKCAMCDKKAFDYCKKNKRQYSYICHAGLFECISPILYNNDIVGFIFAGQIKNSDSSFLISQDNKNFQQLKEEYEKLPFIDKDKVESAIHILEACTGYEYLSNVIKSMDNKLEYSLDLYVSDNIDKYISISDLCDEFHISKNELYSLFNKYFHETPADFIRKKRIYKACELLKNTSLSIATIGLQVGIGDYNYFSKVFKKEKGCSPSSFRKYGEMI